MSITEIATSEETYNYWLGKAVRVRMAERGVMGKTLAHALGMKDASGISNRLGGGTAFRPYELAHIADLLNTTVDALHDKATDLALSAGYRLSPADLPEFAAA